MTDFSKPRRDRLEALLFLEHLVGDLHQPLHVGENGDRGGNDVHVELAGVTGSRLNLHRIWDRELAEDAITTTPRGVEGLTQTTPTELQTWRQGEAVDWARESWEVSRRAVYSPIGLDGICRGGSPERLRIDEGYQRQALPVIRLQVQRAGLRLAYVLNGIFGQ